MPCLSIGHCQAANSHDRKVIAFAHLLEGDDAFADAENDLRLAAYDPALGDGRRQFGDRSAYTAGLAGRRFGFGVAFGHSYKQFNSGSG